MKRNEKDEWFWHAVRGLSLISNTKKVDCRIVQFDPSDKRHYAFTGKAFFFEKMNLFLWYHVALVRSVLAREC
jgi:hypothetical protein